MSLVKIMQDEAQERMCAGEHVYAMVQIDRDSPIRFLLEADYFCS